MAARRLMSSAARAMSGLSPPRAGEFSSVPRASLPNVGAISDLAALPLCSASRRGVTSFSAASRGALTISSSLGNAPVKGLRYFSSGAGGGGRVPPAWMEGVNETPNDLFTSLDWHGRSTVILVYHLLGDEGDNIALKLQAVEKALVQKIQTGHEMIKSSIRSNESTMEKVLKLGWAVGSAGIVIYVYLIGEEFAGRVLEALGQMRLHADEIVRALYNVGKDEHTPNRWPFSKFQLDIPDRWWQDPKKQALREATAAAKANTKAWWKMRETTKEATKEDAPPPAK